MKTSLTLQIILAMILGLIVGEYFGPNIEPIGELAKWFIQIIKVFAIPLLFFAITDSILSLQIKTSGISKMLWISAINACCAISISLFLTNYFKPGVNSNLNLLGSKVENSSFAKDVSWSKSIASLFPDSILGPFVSNSVPAVIILAILIGSAIIAVRKEFLKEFELIENLNKFFLNVLFQIIHWVVKITPFAVFAATAKAIGTQGTALLHSLMIYLLFGFIGMAIQVLLVYQFWIKVVAKISLKKFWSTSKEAILYSMGVNSSLATLPLTLKTMEKLEVSPSAARLSACIGTNFNNDGILLYEVYAALFIAQASGLDLSISQQLNLAFISVVATIGVAGVPEAGIIALSLVLTTLGLPLESIATILTVDWILARIRSLVNTTSDITVGIGINALSKS